MHSFLNKFQRHEELNKKYVALGCLYTSVKLRNEELSEYIEKKEAEALEQADK